MPKELLTREAAKQLGVSPTRLHLLISRNQLDPPQKDGGGRFWWSTDDIKRAKAALEKSRSRGQRASENV
jgi:DNA-binding transcriptional MerR regulator